MQEENLPYCESQTDGAEMGDWELEDLLTSNCWDIRNKLKYLWDIVELIVITNNDENNIFKYLEQLDNNELIDIFGLILYFIDRSSDYFYKHIEDYWDQISTPYEWKDVNDFTPWSLDILWGINTKIDLVLKIRAETKIKPNIEGIFWPVKNLISDLENKNDQERAIIAVDLESMLNGIFQNNEIYWSCYWERKRIRDLPDNLDWVFDLNWSEFSYFLDINKIIIFITEEKFKSRFKKEVWSLNKERLQTNVWLYGAKWANLLEMWEVLTKITEFTWIELWTKIPEFELIPLDIYDKWKGWEDIDDVLMPFFKWAKATWWRVILRSSVEKSEDWELTWAWVYLSKVLKQCSSFELFKQAIIKIYKSVDSNKATDYRKENWVEKERMWVVLQKFVYRSNEWDWVFVENLTINTALSWISELMEVNTHKSNSNIRPFSSDWGLRFIIKKHLDKEWWLIDTYSRDLNIFYIKPEDWMICNNFRSNPIKDISLLSYVLELYYWRPVQLEMVFQSGHFRGYEDMHWSWLNCVQIRPLPKRYSEKQKIEFPNTECLFKWNAFGIGDFELDVLSNTDFNWDKEGVVVFDSNKFASLNIWRYKSALPKKWAAAVRWPRIEWQTSHIETLCLERWILIIYNPNILSHHESQYINPFMERDLLSLEIKDFDWRTRVRVVADWLKGGVYDIEGESCNEKD